MSNKRKLDSPTNTNKVNNLTASDHRPTKRLASPSLVQERIASLHLAESMPAAEPLHNALVQEYQKGSKADMGKMNELLAKLKLEMTKTGLLFPSLSETDLSDGDLEAARQVLEIGAYVSLAQNDMPNFERYLALLKSYYAQQGVASRIPKSKNQDSIEALALLRLLSQNRIADFHTTLELLPFKVIESDEVKWVIRVSTPLTSVIFVLVGANICSRVKLERALMEGAYSRVWKLCSNTSSLPRPEFAHFVSTLVETVRNEIATCDERAYSTLTVRDAQTSLFFGDEQQTRAFAKQRGWHVDSKNVIHFPSSPLHPLNLGNANGLPKSIQSGSSSSSSSAPASNLDKELDKEQVVKSALYYAKNLETIV